MTSFSQILIIAQVILHFTEISLYNLESEIPTDLLRFPIRNPTRTNEYQFCLLLHLRNGPKQLLYPRIKP